MWTALKGSTTLGKVVFFSISKKKLKLRLSFATLSTTRKKTERASRWVHHNYTRIVGGGGRIPGKSEVIL